MEDTPTVPGDVIAGRYTIERELGRGGAAIVFLARDGRQERQVALKVLHRELGQAIGAQRFLREIKHSSALHHPHLLSIHESGEFDGLLYYVMPYMRDGSLRTRIAKEKQLAVDESLRITRQVGEALSYAHSQGIVHRDIKPDNVLFSVDHACLADFGIARAMDAVAMDTLTSTGLVVGTPAYMSPEQASGEREVDARSDQYSLACLLYEMITGLPPFIGATMQSVISQRFTQPPPSMRAHRPSVPDNVERAVKRAMATAPADRFQSVADFVAALHDGPAVTQPASAHAMRRRWFVAGAAAAVVALAVMAAGPGSEWVRGAWGTEMDTAKFVVLPFASTQPVSVEPVDIAALLYANLGRWDGVSVVDEAAARSEVAQRGSDGVSLEEAFAAARRLGAGRLIWGSVASDAGGMRVRAGLYDVGSRSIIRDTLYMSGSAAPADSALRRVLNALLTTPSFPLGFDDGQNGTSSFAAWRAYARGIVLLTAGQFDQSRRELSSSVELDQRFAVANLWLAYVSSILHPKAQHEWAPIAERALTTPGQLQPRDVARAEALLALGRMDYEKACNTMRSMVRSDSLDPHAWFALGECLLVDGHIVRDLESASGWRFRTSLHESGHALLRALELEPRLYSAAIFTRLGRVFMTSLNRLRTGFYVSADSVFMYAYPVASGDTAAFVPYSAEETRSGRARDDPAAHARIIDKNRALMLRAAQSWVSVAPQSGDAFEALAGVLETRGQLSGNDSKASALVSIQRARLLADSAKALPLAGIHVRLLLKAEQFAAARSLADSVLQKLRGTEAHPELTGVMSALTGRPSGMVVGIIAQQFDDMQNLEAPLLQSAAEFVSYSALGICSDRLIEAEKRLESLLASYVAPGRLSAVRRRLAADALSLSAACSTGASALRVEPPAPTIVEMQQAFARGDMRAVRGGFEKVARIRRGSRASQTTPDHLIREAWLRLAIGDTIGAARQVDMVLDALPTISSGTMNNAVQLASLIRVMVFRADVAAATGDHQTARKWARAVAILWGGADPVLHVTVARMNALARNGVVE